MSITIQVNDVSKLRLRKIDHSRISIQPIYFRLIREVIGSLKNPIFDKQFETKYGSTLNNTVIFGFKIGYNNQFWEIRRTLKQFYELDKDLKNFAQDNKLQNQTILPKEKDDPNQTLQHLTKYLKIHCGHIKISDCLLNFLEISCIELPLKFKECFMLKKAGGRENQSIFKTIESKLSKYKKRYFIITQQSLLYLIGPDEQNCVVKECLNFDPTLHFIYGKKETGKNNKIIIYFLQRKLIIRAENIFNFIDFIFALQSVVELSPYTKIHRYGSFSPIRMSYCQWYVDGKDYFSDIYDAILRAKKTIFITDWWMSPQLYLKRPIHKQFNEENQQFRLMFVLKHVANNGVSVLILLYNSYNKALYNNPKYCQKLLESLSPNIKVLRHPKKFPIIKFSHHEKIVVIDQTIGFMGGLDLCYGRWDDSKHVLFEPDPQNPFFPEIDFSNSRIRDFIDVSKYQKTLLNENEPRMPWHDIAIQIQGDSVIDLSRHFVQYWNHCVMGKKKKLTIGFLQANDLEIRNYEQQKSQEINQNIQISRTKTFEDNIQQFLNTNQFQNHSQYLEIKPVEESDESGGSEKQGLEEKLKIWKKFQKPKQAQQSQTQISQNLEYFLTDLTQYHQKSFSCITQLTRSSSRWSTGIKYTELSIQNAYLHLISQAKQFIYIENQFFISKSAGEIVKNSISFAIVERIKRAHLEKQKFKIIVFMPLLPGFEGEIDQPTSTLLKVQLHYEYATISRGGSSIIEQLKGFGINPSDYINFYGLRQHGKSQNNIPVTEIIYIHSKLLIVDDEVALIGSANINDRSLNGDRDSELAIIVQDQTKIESFMNGVPLKVPKFSHTLRTTIFCEHFGLSYEQVKDPLSPQLENEIKNRTSANTKYYRTIFGCYPDDEIRKISDYSQKKLNRRLDSYDELSQFIKGAAVEFPLNFLCEEDLRIKIYEKEQILGQICFT